MKCHSLPLIGLSLLAAMLLGSCTTHRYVAKSMPSPAPTGIAVVDPFSYICLCQKGGQSILNDSVSNVSHDIIEYALGQNDGTMPTGSIIYPVNDTLYQTLGDEAYNLAIQCKETRRKYIPSITLPPTMAYFMNDNDLSQAFFIVHGGMMYTRSGYIHDLGLILGATVASVLVTDVIDESLGTTGNHRYVDIYTPSPYNSTLYVLMADATTNSVQYLRVKSNDIKPTNHKQLYKQLYKAFKQYPM